MTTRRHGRPLEQLDPERQLVPERQSSPNDSLPPDLLHGPIEADVLCFYSSKGGAGCSVTAAATAILLARHRPTLLVDLGGDQSDLLGLSPSRPTDDGRAGLTRWLDDPSPGPDALRRLELAVTGDLSLLVSNRDASTGDAARLRLLASLLGAETRSVVVDVGQDRRFEPLLGQATRSVLVTRSCYLSLTRARERPTPDDIVLVAEPHRALTAADIEAVLDAPIAVTVPYEPQVFRAIDAGLLVDRLPRSLRRLEVFA